MGWLAGKVSVDGAVRVRTRRGRDVTASLPELAPLADTLAGRSVILDGELVTCAAGAVDFYRVARETVITAFTMTPRPVEDVDGARSLGPSRVTDLTYLTQTPKGGNCRCTD